MKFITTISLVVVGVIHLLPLSGVLSSERLAVLYGIVVNDPNIEILMRHRAVLFGLLGAFLLYAAFNPAYQLIAFIAGFVSIVSFLYLASAVGEYNFHIKRVYIADIVALVSLLCGVGSYVYRRAVVK